MSKKKTSEAPGTECSQPLPHGMEWIDGLNLGDGLLGRELREAEIARRKAMSPIQQRLRDAKSLAQWVQHALSKTGGEYHDLACDVLQRVKTVENMINIQTQNVLCEAFDLGAKYQNLAWRPEQLLTQLLASRSSPRKAALIKQCIARATHKILRERLQRQIDRDPNTKITVHRRKLAKGLSDPARDKRYPELPSWFPRKISAATIKRATSGIKPTK